jgi:ADP-ribose pyrophosphatase
LSRPTDGLPVVQSSTVAYRGHIFDVLVDEIRMPDGTLVTRDTVSHPGAVVMAALDERGRVVLVRQYRHAIRSRLLEFPAGTLGKGEEPLDAARRELREEAGLLAARWDPLGSFFSSPGFLKEELHVYLARELTQTDQDLEPDEDIVLEWRDLAQLLRAPEELADAKTLAVLLLVAVRLGEEGDGHISVKE